MKKFIARATRFTAIFFAVFALVFSSLPYQALNSLVSDYVRTYKVVDEAITALEPKTAEARIEFAGDGLMVYSQSGNSTPRQRFWIQSNLAFQAASSTVAGNIALQTRVMTSPTRREAIAGYVNASGNLQISCFNGETWSNDWNVTVGGTGTTRRFDIAYEKTSGDVMVMYSTNAGTTNELAYRTKSGSNGCGTANWSGATNVDPVRTSGVVNWVRLEAQPLSGSNRIAAMWLDANADVSALHWDGSAWQSEPAAALETNTERASAAADTESFDMAWETLSGELMVILSSVSGTNAATGAYWSTSTCTTTCTWRSATSSIAILDDATHLDVAADPLSDQIAFYALGNAGADTSAAIWNGNAWTASANRDTAAQAPTAGRQFVAVGWLNNGGTKRAVATYYDSATTNIGWDVANGTTWTLQTDATPTPVFGTQNQYKIIPNPYVPSELLFIVHDANSDLFAKRLTMTATPAFTWTNADGGAALEATGASTIYPFGDFAFWNYIRPAIQVVEGGSDPAAQTIAPGTATTTVNTFRLRTSTSTETVTAFTLDIDSGDAATASAGLESIEIFRPGDNTSLGVTYNPTDSVNVLVSGMTATTSSSTLYQIRVKPKSHANMPAVPGVSYGIRPRITNVNNGFSIHNEIFDTTTNTLTIDNTSPGNVTSATVTAGDGQNILTWVNPSTFPTTGVLDTFNRANENPLSLGWGGKFRAYQTSTFRVVNNQANRVTGAVADAEDGAYWNQSTFGVNSEAFVDIVTKPANDTEAVFLTVRIVNPNTTSVDGYSVGLWPQTGADIIRFYRIDNDVPTQLGSDVLLEFSNGDGLGVRMIGDRITAYRRSGATWSSIDDRVDGTYSAGGNIGIANYTISGSPAVVVDNFGGGNFDFNNVIVLRRTGSAVSVVPEEGQTYATSSVISGGPGNDATVVCSGLQTSCTDGSLTNGTAYHYEIFTQDTRGNWDVGVVPTGSPATPTAPTFTQSGYRFFANSDDLNPGMPLAGESASTTLAAANAQFRLRQQIGIGTQQLALNGNGRSFKLQYAVRSGTCDTSFAGETYADVTAATPVAFYDNPSVSDGANTTGTTTDPGYLGTVNPQTYEELNNFTNSQSVIPNNEAGIWDFSLVDNGAPAGTVYCLRVVQSTGTALDTYTNIPEVKIFEFTGITISGTFFAEDGTTPFAGGLPPGLKLAVGASTAYTTSASDVNGTFSFTSLPQPADGTLMTLWSTSVATATSVFRYGSGCTGYPNCTGLSLLRDHIFLRNFVPANPPITNSDLSACDNNTGTVCGQTPDVRIGFTADTGDGPIDFEATNATSTLRIGTGTTYAPGGTVTAENVQVDGTLDTGSSNSVRVTGWGNSNTCGFSGSNNPVPFCVNGGGISGTGIIEYQTPTSTAIQSRTYPKLSLVSSPGASPTYSLVGTTAFNVTDLFIGNNGFGSAVTFSASTTNPTMSITNLDIDTGSTFVCSTSTMTISGNFENAGYIDTRGNTIAFTATAGGRTFNPGLGIKMGAPGDLDVRFDGDGKVASNAASQEMRDSLLLGRWLFTVGYDSDVNWRIEKRNVETGELDPGFGTSGVVTGSSVTESANAITTDGTWIYVAGTEAGDYPTYQWRIEKRNATTGALDPNFGTAGAVRGFSSSYGTGVGSAVTDIVYALETLYVLGRDANGWRLENRIPESGDLNPYFATGGVYTSSSASSAAFVLQFTGSHILLIGTDDNNDWRIEKISQYSGELETTSFGTAGVVTSASASFVPYAAFVSGSAVFITGSDGSDWRIEKRDTVTGALDPVFGTSGVVTGSSATGVSTGMVGDGGFLYVAGGDSNGDLRIEKRRMTDGALDMNFGSSGVVTSELGVFFDISYVTVNVDWDSIYLAGSYDGLDKNWFIEKRFKDSGSGTLLSSVRAGVPPTFQTTDDELVLLSGSAGYSVGYDYSSATQSYILVKRFLNSNDLDESFGSAGIVPIPSFGSDNGAGFDVSVISTGGNLYIAGEDSDIVTSYWRIEKRNAVTGALNTGGFGTGGVIVSSGGVGRAKVITDGSSIYVYGNAANNSDWRVEKRSFTSGALDSGGFGTGGVVTSADGLALRKVVIAGSSLYLLGIDESFNHRIEKRSLATGALDTGFGVSGAVTVPSTTMEVRDIVADSNSLYVIGIADGGTFIRYLRLEKRQLTDGSLVSSGFGSAGVVLADDFNLPTPDNWAGVISGSSLYILGTNDGQLYIEKRSASGGSLDQSFGDNQGRKVFPGNIFAGTANLFLQDGIFYGSRDMKVSESLRTAPHFRNLTFSGSGGWTMPEDAFLSVSDDLTVSNGTFGGSGTVSVYGDVAGNGTINFTDGAFFKIGSGTFGGDAAWTFQNLNFFPDMFEFFTSSAPDGEVID